MRSRGQMTRAPTLDPHSLGAIKSPIGLPGTPFPGERPTFEALRRRSADGESVSLLRPHVDDDFARRASGLKGAMSRRCFGQMESARVQTRREFSRFDEAGDLR
jgi:hypothetical protein